MLFLQHPPAAVDILLNAHAKHMTSSEHAAEVKRSRHVDESDVRAVEEKRHQIQRTCQVANMRSQRRQMNAMQRKLTAGDVGMPPEVRAVVYQNWQGDLANLEARLDEATARHGYGPTSTGHLQAPRAKLYVDSAP